ncbi:Hypothetical predicted protein [Olea europaea subsp. europaea]|uniref:Uncharacterized protein n=1 Tax=Olea europaea subsp. europaea TaxID=158383 RepID=A0A8S0PAL4_OLEEU|nr:Hypothetical predicted protein [Olea europaea subsp. europaea]
MAMPYMNNVMPYMNNVQYKKLIQPDFSSEKIKKSAGHASTSRKSEILLTDSSIGQPNIADDDDDFVDPPSRRQESSLRGKSPIDEAPSTTHNSPNESHPHRRNVLISMDEIMRTFSEKIKDHDHTVGGTQAHEVGEPQVVRGSDDTDNVETVQKNVDRKWKGKMDPSEETSIPCSLQPPSFNLGIGYTQPDDVHSEAI